MSRHQIIGSMAAGLLLVAAPFAAAQGLLVATKGGHPLPRPSRPEADMAYRIKELSVRAKLVDQVARVQVTQSFVNTGSRAMEVAFVFPLPYDGAIDQLTLMVDGKEFPARLLPADQARTIYESYIQRNQDPALLQWMGTGMFQTSVFPVPPGAQRTVNLRYNQLLRKDGTLTDFLFPLSTARYTSVPVEKVDIQVQIESGIELTSVYSPTHDIEVQQTGAHQASVGLVRSNEVPASDFRLFFDVAKGRVGASVISYRPRGDEDGYFLLLASPRASLPSDQRPAKNVVCVFDRSGSMEGDKIEQARQALKSIIGNLEKDDWFNIVAYDTEVESFQPTLLPASEVNRKKALGFVEGMYAGGGTNIAGALHKVLGMLTESARPNYIIFMTDGQPTIGETNESKIVAASQASNKFRARLISFGVGYDVNSRLLDRLAVANHGQSHYVRPDEDIQQHVERMYAKISAPVMTDVMVQFEFDSAAIEEGNPISRSYPQGAVDLFEGEQLALVGRYRKSGPAKVIIQGMMGADQHSLDFTTDLTELSVDETYGFVEKLWAMRRIGELIDELDLHGKNDELIKELVALSTRHGILTPYTSFLADDLGDVDRFAQFRGRGSLESVNRSSEALQLLDSVEGRSAFAQRALKSAFKGAAKAPADQSVVTAVDGKADPNAAFAGNAVIWDVEKDKADFAYNIRQVGNHALYKCGNTWVAADVAERDLDELKNKVHTVERFSKEYFSLIRKCKASENALLGQQQSGEELLLEIDGRLTLVR